MMHRLARILAMVCLLAAPGWAQVSIDGRSTFTLATAEQGRAVLSRSDTFIEQISPWDRAARLGKDGQASAQEFLAFVKAQVLDWSPEERAANLEALKGMVETFKPYARWMPPEVLLVKTTGREGHGGAYTRQNAIIFQGGTRRGPIAAGLLAHELWHVISRGQPVLRDRMYAILGFEFCGPLQWPASLDRLRVTNPDAPVNQHWIKIKYQGQEYHAMPVITAGDETFGRGAGSSLNFLQTRLLMVEKAPDGKAVVAVMKDGQPLLATFDQVENFYEQVGRNTTYLIHPEECVADQVSMIIAGSRTPPPSPEILDKMKALLLAPATAANR